MTLFNEDIKLVYDSWRLLMERNVEVIVAAHGKPFNIINLVNNIDKNKQGNVVKIF